MNKLKHTKGNMFSKEHYIFCEGKSFPIGQSFLVNTVLKHDGTMEPDLQGIANAKLWSSASELLEALMACVQVFEAQLDQNEWYYKQAVNAIKKATGN